MSQSWREVEDFRVTPDQLRALGMGEVVMMTGAKLYHLKTPMLNFPKKLPPFEIVRRHTRVPSNVKCLHFEQRLNEFLTEVGEAA